MTGRRPTVCAAVIAAVLGLGSARAEEPVRLVAQETIRGLEIRLVAGSFGRILDVSTSDRAPEQTDLKFFVAGNDVTRSVLSRPPLIEIAYIFTGISATRQCSFKVQLDAALSSISAFNLAYSDIENTLCPEFGIRPLQLWQTDFVAPGDYSRLLVIDVAGKDRANAPVALANVWAQLEITAAIFDDKARLIGDVTGFVEAHIFGGWSILPAGVAPAGVPLTITFADSSGVFFTLNDGASTAPAFLDRARSAVQSVTSRNLWVSFLVLALLGIAIATAAARMLKRRPGRSGAAEENEPLRAIAVGYGAGRKYSLGEGAERDVALVMVYPSGRMRIVRKSEDDPILVNGTSIGQEAWITAADRVIIGAKQFQFT